MLVRVATLVPLTGTLVDMALALVVLFFGEALRGRAESSSVVRRAFAQAFAFDGFYRERPPRPFVYYVFYPLLFPYWMVNREARAEFLLFRNYTFLSLVVLALSNLYSFFFLYRPELGIRDFIAPFFGGLIVESIVVLALLMPLVTTVFALHRAGSRAGLWFLFALGAASTAYGVVHLVTRRAPIVSLETRARILARTTKKRDEARFVLINAVHAAQNSQNHAYTRLAEDGTIEGAPRDAARAALMHFYRKDEAAGFDVWATPERIPKLVVVYAEGRREQKPIWVGIRNDGTIVNNVADLPRQARAAMKELSEF